MDFSSTFSCDEERAIQGVMGVEKECVFRTVEVNENSHETADEEAPRRQMKGKARMMWATMKVIV